MLTFVNCRLNPNGRCLSLRNERKVCCQHQKDVLPKENKMAPANGRQPWLVLVPPGRKKGSQAPLSILFAPTKIQVWISTRKTLSNP